MNAEDFLKGLGQSPDFLFQDVDLINRRGLVVRFDRESYQRASFLDHRAFRKETLGAWLPLANILRQAGALAEPPAAHAIFHISHCGSTLLSRLLAESGGLPLREPLVLLACAQAQRELEQPVSRLDADGWDQLFDATVKLLSRVYQPGERAFIKATSACGNLLAPFLGRSATSKALLLYTDLETWLTVMLRNDDVRGNGRFYASAWLKDLRALTGRRDIRLSALADAEMFAINWLTAMLHFERARQHSPHQVRHCDFERLLADPPGELASACRFLGLDTAQVPAIAAGPLMKDYSKRPGEVFDAATRARELREARQANSAELSAGITYAERLCGEIEMLRPLTAYLTRSNVRNA
ncbi:MAG TPA: hypothetical protein VLV87_04875 [Gammaproteobacteria bacterium]|nr:hypothetical protein [Gammaproteobacteria bacterium]